MRRLLIITFISINSGLLSGQYTADSALSFADQQYLRGNYSLALKEYQRVSFHDNFSDAYLLFKIGDCYLNQGDWTHARYYYDQVIRITHDDSLLVNAEIRNISTRIQEEAYKRALINLYSVHDTVYRQYNDEINLLFGITHFGLTEFDTSRYYFKKIVETDSLACAKIDSLFSLKKMLYKPNPNLAYALSLVIPGLGQLYAGDVPDALNSFILSGSLVGLSVFVAYQYTLLDAILSILPWYQRYYMGGLENTNEIAEKKRQERRSSIYRATLDIIRESKNKQETL
ncbi:MAG: tetratricopeptide repeat protein [Bacteroidales bacterium]|nr:tetratricopeptide repeat protein [Bacteroidales bacterium]